MNKYGLVAVKAVSYCSSGSKLSPRVAWDQIATQIFKAGTAAQKKGCPRNAFLGLCEEGAVKGIPKGKYCNSIKNKKYALSAIQHLQRDQNLSEHPLVLWKKVLKGETKAHNSQMDVVIALWNAGLVERISENSRK